jgi:hypothetical protein
MEKTMYALVYTYEGYYNSAPYSVVIAVSNDENKLIKEMEKCINSDIEIDEDDDFNEEKNFNLISNWNDNARLQHKNTPELYIKYEIQVVDVL